jgi:glycosyltransferase involved in cell wall biosynthesis
MNPLITICATSYQSAATVRESLLSVAKSLGIIGVDYEVVVVDNYSNDGTYEELVRLSEEIPMRIYRYRCSRGLGRAICVKLAKGEYILRVDLDRIYNEEQLGKLVSCYLRLRDKIGRRCMGLCPRDLLIEVNYRDLNRAEDVDLYARLIRGGYVFAHPCISMWREEHALTMRKSRLLPLISPILGTAYSELRYAESPLSYLRRELRNKLDTLSGGAYTLRKSIREDFYIWSRYLHISGIFRYLVLIMRTLIAAVLLLINKSRGVEVYEASRNVSNHLYTYISIASSTWSTWTS